MKHLMKHSLGGAALLLSLSVLSACGSEVSSSGSADNSGLEGRIASLEKQLASQGEKSIKQDEKIAALEKKLEELNSTVTAANEVSGNGSATSGNNGSAGKGDGIRITFAQYEKLEVGMTYDEVKEIIGGEGEALSEAENTVVYSYKGAGDTGANAILAFQGGKLLTKAQSGLN
ncbi:hypothetical protein AB1I68_27875 [Paenibacillus pabuli]|uniref:hypothetical protein n=1 Tax=Paenibacillus pabuli TaxID=1472 RepID=UPI003458DD90